MGFQNYARQVRDERLPVTRRHSALRLVVVNYCPLGFHATWAYLAATARPAPDLRRDPAALLRALETLEASRAVWLGEVAEFTARRQVEKAAGRRAPSAGDTTRRHGPHWPSEAAPSRPGLVAAVADRRTAFLCSPYPDETLHPDGQARRLAGLYARLDDCAASYVTGLGHVGAANRAALAETVHGIEHLVHRDFPLLNRYLHEWLWFARLVSYAVEVSPGRP